MTYTPKRFRVGYSRTESLGMHQFEKYWLEMEYDRGETTVRNAFKIVISMVWKIIEEQREEERKRAMKVARKIAQRAK